MRAAAGLASVLLALAPAAAQATGLDWALALCPQRNGKIDPTANVDKDLLASAVLDEAKVPRRLEAGVPVPRGARLTRWQTMVAENRTLCSRGLDCGKDGADALGRASALLQFIFDDTTEFEVVAPDRRAMAFFTDERSALRCRAPSLPDVASTTTATTETANAPGPSDRLAFSWTNFRVRGGADDLVYERGTSGFADADKATLSFGNDEGKGSTKLVGAFGYALSLADGFRGDSHGYVTLIPYFSANLDWSKKKGAARDVSSDLIDFGAVLEFSRSVAHVSTPDPTRPDELRVTHSEDYLAAIPRLITNYKDGSQVAGLDLLYRPSYARGLNSLVQIGGSDFWWSSILDFRFNNGVFTRTGSRDVASSRDFSRVGGRVGLSLVSDVKGVPAEFTLSDTWLWALAGQPGHLSQLKTNLSLYLNAEKYFGLDLGYARGRIGDLDARDDKWTIGLAIKY